MSLKGIDVSNWQTGINLEAVPADFVIMKATQGDKYVNPDLNRQYEQAKKAGRLLGVYHFAASGDVKTEADHFLSTVKDYIGEAILIIDCGADDNSTFGKNNLNWVKQLCDYVYSKTSVKPMIYIQQSVMDNIKGLEDYGLWVAQHANTNITGYQANPWNEDSCKCVIRQYSRNGRLAGYASDLNLNKFYGDAETWKKYADKSEQTIQEQKQYYTVVKGDKLPVIAKRNNTTTKQLVAWNNLKDPNKIYPGQKLRVK